MIDEVMKNIYRVEVPLPGSPLKSINSYIIKGERNLIIDTGMNREECEKVLSTAIAELKIDLNKTDFFITHIHADHSGLVLKLKSESSKIFFNKPESELINRTDYWMEILNFAMRHGFPQEELQNALLKHPGYKYSPRGKIVPHIVYDGDIIPAGNYKLKCIETPGHTRGHICLYEENCKFLFSGDHLLLDITSNISSWDDSDNPLADYLESLTKVSKLKVEVVFPGHRRIFKNFYERIEELKEHHEKRLNEILAILQHDGYNAYQVASRMTWDIDIKEWQDFPVSQKWFAHGEAIAHLKYLETTGQVKSRIDDRILVYYLQ